ncbi:MAG: hypothetical protein LUM44_07735 [Pyrinomonadaceae bacterium]|nr:hypothetical protein [Pyrinomonadaceae bacterium]
MKSAVELFWKGINHNSTFTGTDTTEAVEFLNSAAKIWRSCGKYCAAGFAMSRCSMILWEKEERSIEYSVEAIKDYRNCIENAPPNIFEGIVAIHCWIQQLKQVMPNASNSGDLNETVGKLRTKLAQLLTEHFQQSADAQYYLVKGFSVRTNFKDDWEAEFNNKSINDRSTTWSTEFFNIGLSPAFSLFLETADYEAANNIIIQFENSFDNISLKGWRSAVQGFANPQASPEKFAEAADIFAQDTHPGFEEVRKRGMWDSTNIELWAKYFKARSELAYAIEFPEQAKEHIINAAKCFENKGLGWLDPNVSRFKILVQTLARLVGNEESISFEEAKEQLFHTSIFLGEYESDAFTSTFLDLSFQSLKGFETDPATEITTGRLTKALDALSKIPLLGQDAIQSAIPFIGKNALEKVLGLNQTWIHRTLENITDENSVLQKIILRLLQASIPSYAQIRQGPLEYGKDIVVLIEEEGKFTLRMYQVKCGDINMSKWREARNELEEAFLVKLPSLQINEQVDKTEVILICNGHAKPSVEPVMDGWFKEQSKIYGRVFRFIHLDGFVSWILKDRLVSEFKSALSELNLKPFIEN